MSTPKAEQMIATITVEIDPQYISDFMAEVQSIAEKINETASTRSIIITNMPTSLRVYGNG